MSYFNKNNLNKIIEVGGARIAGFFIIFYSVLFITFFGGVVELGRFSAVGAILSPLTMFVTFRYIELIGISADKSKTFSELVISAFSIYFCVVVFIGFWVDYYQSRDIRLSDFILMVTYKSVELFGDILAVVLIQTRKGGEATKIAVYKTAIIVALSLVLHFYFYLPALDAVYISLIFGFLIVFLLVEIRVCKKYNLLIRRSLDDVLGFIKSNFSLGVFNALMSLNSVVPRYYILYFGDLRQLGVFSLIYQLSSTSVNLLEYVSGIYVRSIARGFIKKKYISRLILSGYIISFVLIIFGLIIENHSQFGYFIISGIAMFMVLMGRGVSVVICLGLSVGVNYAGLMLATMMVGSIVVYALEYLSFMEGRLFFAFLYVLVASSTFGFMLLKAANKEVMGGK